MGPGPSRFQVLSEAARINLGAWPVILVGRSSDPSPFCHCPSSSVVSAPGPGAPTLAVLVWRVGGGTSDQSPGGAEPGYDTTTATGRFPAYFSAYVACARPRHKFETAGRSIFRPLVSLSGEANGSACRELRAMCLSPRSCGGRSRPVVTRADTESVPVARGLPFPPTPLSRREHPSGDRPMPTFDAAAAIESPSGPPANRWRVVSRRLELKQNSPTIRPMRCCSA